MIKVAAIKFGSSVNVGNTEVMFIKDDVNAKCDVFYDADANCFLLRTRKSLSNPETPLQETIVFSTNVQWARLKETNEPGEAKTRSTRGPGTKATP